MSQRAQKLHSRVVDLKKKDFIQVDLRSKSKAQQVFWRIIRDLSRLNWRVKAPTKRKPLLTIVPPKSYDKDTVRDAMSIKRQEIIDRNQKWIDKHLKLAHSNLANGIDVIHSNIDPVIEVCETQKQHDLFRILRYYWSSPYSE